VSADDGAIRAKLVLSSMPVFNGLAAA